MPKVSQSAERISRRPKSPGQLPESLNRKLNAYALAAAAAGVTVVASAMPAEGAPICKTVSATILQSNTFPLNPANAAFAPFNVAQTTMSTLLSTFRRTTTPPLSGLTSFWWNRGFFTPNTAGAEVLLGTNNLPAKVAPGSAIGPGGKFGKGASYGLLFTYGRGNFSVRAGGTSQKHRGNLSLVHENFVGFQFSDAGQLHYGWARLTVSFHAGRYVAHPLTALEISVYGYETTPNTAIAAGSCSAEQASNGDVQYTSPTAANPSLGMLALGSEGLASWRSSLF
jgi:hypothetical protein